MHFGLYCLRQNLMFVFVVLIVHVALEYIFITIFYNLQLCYFTECTQVSAK